MAKERTYTDILWCDICNKDTEQTVHDSGHERDSSGDWQECMECGAYFSGLTGKWEPKHVSESVPKEKIVIEKISLSPESIMDIHFRSFEQHKEGFVESIRLAKDEKDMLRILSACINIMIEKYSTDEV